MESATAEREALEEQGAEELERQQAALDNDPGAEEPYQEDAGGELALVVGADGQLSFAVGGKQPTSSSIRLTGGSIQIPLGQLKKGEDIELRVVARVSAVEFVDTLDGTTKQAVGCERRHKARIVDIGLLAGEE